MASGLFLQVVEKLTICCAKFSVGSLQLKWLFQLLEEDSEVFLKLCWFKYSYEDPYLDLSSTLTYNKRLVLPTAGIVSAAISSKTGFVEWHTARGGQVSYANYFLASWPGSDLIIGSSTSVVIKKGVVDEIGATTPVGKGEEKKVKKDAGQKSKAQEVVEGSEASQGTKKMKTASTRNQLVVLEDPKEKDYSAIGMDVNHPPILKIRVTTKVETSIL